MPAREISPIQRDTLNCLRSDLTLNHRLRQVYVSRGRADIHGSSGAGDSQFRIDSRSAPSFDGDALDLTGSEA
jgi:hypothetical protein